MKQIIFLLFIFLNYSNLVAQETKEGIYLTASDFINHKISFTPIEGQKYKIRLNEFWNNPFIKIIIGDSTYKIKKDSIFGYRDKDTIVHRFYDGNTYTVLNPNETILLYSKTTFSAFKTSQTIVNYYFSKAANTEVIPLTKWNLKHAFPTDSIFHELLDMEFSSDSNLIFYDSFYKIYKINRLFQVSKQIILKIK